MPLSDALYPAVDPAHATSLHRIRVRFCETDLMGIVHHANYLLYFEEGRVEWLRRRGVTYGEWAAEGIHLPVVEARLRYKAPARFDDELTVATSLTEVRAYSLRFAFVLRRDVILAEGDVRLACVNDSHKLRRLEESMTDVLLAGERP